MYITVKAHMYMHLYIYIYWHTYVCIYMCKHLYMSHLSITVQVYNIQIPWALKVTFLRWPGISPRTSKPRMCVQTSTLVVLVDQFFVRGPGTTYEFLKTTTSKVQVWYLHLEFQIFWLISQDETYLNCRVCIHIHIYIYTYISNICKYIGVPTAGKTYTCTHTYIQFEEGENSDKHCTSRDPNGHGCTFQPT